MTVIRFQKYIAGFSVILLLAKLFAWYITNSVMVLTDALEGCVNVVAGFLGLYSVILAAKPRDTNHPFGHSKVEYLTSAVEGTLIMISAFVIMWEAGNEFLTPHHLQRLNTGLLVVVGCGLVNYALGKIAEQSGRKQNSIVLQAAGKHLITDGYSSLAIIVGMALLFTLELIPETKGRFLMLDSIVGIVFAVVILVTGYRVLRRSISGIMDEVDQALVQEVVVLLQESRQPQWIDLHNFRVIQYGNMLHIDAHLSLPRYYSVETAGKDIQHLSELINNHFGRQVELFVHVDACLPMQCRLCAQPNCGLRQADFEQQVVWNMENVWEDEMHRIN